MPHHPFDAVRHDKVGFWACLGVRWNVLVISLLFHNDLCFIISFYSSTKAGWYGHSSIDFAPIQVYDDCPLLTVWLHGYSSLATRLTDKGLFTPIVAIAVAFKLFPLVPEIVSTTS